jgi:hypothetical protein
MSARNAMVPIDFPTGLSGLLYRRKSGSVACRIFERTRFAGGYSHQPSAEHYQLAVLDSHYVPGVSERFSLPRLNFGQMDGRRVENVQGDPSIFQDLFRAIPHVSYLIGGAYFPIRDSNAMPG